MKKLLLFLTGTISWSVSISQKNIPDFGYVEKADLEMKSCSFEPDAHAMVLFDSREIKFEISNYDTKLITERRVRIKIFDEKGYAFATTHIPYYKARGFTKIKDLSGVVYNLDENGKIIVRKLEKKDFFKEKSEDQLTILNFTFPNLKSGSIVEYRYTKIEREEYEIDPWIIQKEIPVAYSLAIITAPIKSRLKLKLFGSDSLGQSVVNTKRGYDEKTIRTYYKENIPSFLAEPFMSSSTDNLMKVNFFFLPLSNFFTDTLTSPQVMWKYTAQNYLHSKSFGDQLKINIPGTENLVDSALKITNSSEKIAYIFREVQKRAPQNPEQAISVGDIVEAWKSQSGNSAEMNLVLLNLLIKAKITCYPILVSTRSHGKVDMGFPSPSQLNGVDVIAVDSSAVYIMDPSLKYQAYNNPPLNILNRTALLLDPEDVRWVMVSDERMLFRQNTDIISEFKEDGILEGTATLTHYDYAKSTMLDTASSEEEEDKFFDNKPSGLTLKKVEQDTVNAFDPLVQRVDFTFEPQKSNEFYFINPQLLFFKNSNPFVREIRNTDIDFGCNQQLNLRFQMDIPKEFQVVELPKNIVVRAPDTSFYFKRVYTVDSSHVYLNEIFEISRPVFDRADYPAVKEFFTRAYALMSEEIILKKKN